RLTLLKRSKSDRIQDYPRLDLQFGIVCRHEIKKAECIKIMLSQILQSIFDRKYFGCVTPLAFIVYAESHNPCRTGLS
ncbi:hypothetical protein, partial [Chlorogloeopsis fritschii]|uniref:hypothetical protein n=1 Tax=Chlorogloeopsis fritschii TaxID=1124 RepID=UPI001F2124EF